MVLCDVNVLVYAFREDVDNHVAYYRWLNEQGNSDEAFGVSDLVLSGFLRLVTNRRVFRKPSQLDVALRFAMTLRELPAATPVQEGPRHWEIFTRLCRQAGAKGNLVPDAYFAALAIESGAEWITTDRDYARFPGLHWRHPPVDGP